MKKALSILFLLSSVLAITSCSSNDKTKIYAQNENKNVIEYGDAKLIFKDNSNVPYINIKDGVSLMDKIRKEANPEKKDVYYKFEIKDNNVVISNESDAKCTINKTNQTVSFDDYDKFSKITFGVNPILATDDKLKTDAIKLVKSEYNKGNAVIVDLNKYSKLDIYTDKNEYYLPVSTFNSLLFQNLNVGNLHYNLKSLYFVPTSGLFVNIPGVGSAITSLGQHFSDGINKNKISGDYFDYNYQSMCLDFDVNYGLKNKFKTFDEFVQANNLKTDLLQDNVKLIDSSTAACLSYLNDGHTLLIKNSLLYEFANGEKMDITKYNPARAAYETSNEDFIKRRKNAGLVDGIKIYESAPNVAFVTFSEFSPIVDASLYNPFFESDEDDTAYLFSQLYKTVTNDSRINKVVVDLSANDGGHSDSLIYALSVLLGDVTFNMSNPLTGAYNTQTYKADINLDGKIDEKDIGLIDNGVKIYFINSKYTFSSANAMTVNAKILKPNVVTLGETSGGGPCAIKNNMSPLFNIYSSSSLDCFSKFEGTKLVDIDGGVNADHQLTLDQMIDRESILSNINNW